MDTSPYKKAEVSASLFELKMKVKQNKALTRDDATYQVRHPIMMYSEEG